MILPHYITDIIGTLEKAGYEAYVVGGCVRDALLELKPKDYDIATNALPETVLQLFSHTIPTGLKHGTVTVVSEQRVEITTYRTDSQYTDHRHPDAVSFVRSIKEDLARRDFTINAMAYHPQRGLYDPFDGQTDLKNGIIRCVGDPLRRFEEDALRMLRAHRFAARYHFQIEQSTKQAMEQKASLISCVSVERIRKEVIGILEGNPYEIENMTQLLSDWIPELELCRACAQSTPYHDCNVLHHSLRAVALLEPFDETLAYTLLMHDLGKPMCKSTKNNNDHFYGHAKIGARIARRICHDWKLTNVQKKTIESLILYHDAAMDEPLSFIHDFRIRLHWTDQRLRQLFEIKRCDIMAHSAYGQKTINQLTALEKVYDACVSARPMALKDLAIDGNDVMIGCQLQGQAIQQALQDALSYAFYHPSENKKESLIHYLKGRRA